MTHNKIGIASETRYADFLLYMAFARGRIMIDTDTQIKTFIHQN